MKYIKIEPEVIVGLGEDTNIEQSSIETEKIIKPTTPDFILFSRLGETVEALCRLVFRQ